MTDTAKAVKQEEYSKEEYLEFTRAKAHKAAPPSYFQCSGLANAACPCKGCGTARALNKASIEWDADRGAAAKESLVAEFGPKSTKKAES